MRILISGMMGAILTAAVGMAQPPRPAGEPPPRTGRPDGGPAALMNFDKDKDGKVTRAEVTDERMLRLFDRADANKDGVVTKEEIAALTAQEGAMGGERGGRPEGGRFGRPGERGGREGFMRLPPPGQVLPAPIQDSLRLTTEQKQQVDALQKEIDSKLAKILTDEQMKRIKEMGERRGPPGFEGGRPGEGRPGDPGRRPPTDRP